MSPEFIVNFKTYKLSLTLVLYPWGYSEDYNGEISLHPLFNYSCYQNYFVINVGIIGNDGQPSDIKMGFFTKFSEMCSDSCLFPNFVNRNKLIERKSDLLRKGNTLTIRCLLMFSNDYVHASQPTTSLLPVDQETPNDFEQFLYSVKFSDAKLVFKNGIELPVHRMILSARSRVFAAMFSHDMKEKIENKLEISDIEVEVMREVLRFIYTGKVDNMDGMAGDLLTAADKYAIEGLKNICENSLIQGLNLMNVMDVLEMADRRGIKSLKEAALNFVTDHVKELSDSEKFRTSMKSVSCMLGEVLNALSLRYK